MIIITTMTMIIIIIAILPSSSTHCGCPAWGRLEHRGRFSLGGVSSKLLFWVYIIQKFTESWFILPRVGLWSSHIIIMITSKDAPLFSFMIKFLFLIILILILLLLIIIIVIIILIIISPSYHHHYDHLQRCRSPSSAPHTGPRSPSAFAPPSRIWSSSLQIFALVNSNNIIRGIPLVKLP